MLGVNLPFRRRTRTGKIAFAALLFLVGGSSYIVGRAEEAAEQEEANEFLELAEGQRFFWFEGAFRTAGHLIAMRDEKQADCALNWYLNDRDNKREILERTIAEHGNHSETTVVLSAIANACGSLVPGKSQ